MYTEKRLMLLENTVSELMDVIVRHGSPGMTREITELVHQHNEQSDRLMDEFVASVFKGGGDHVELKKRLSMTPSQSHIKPLESDIAPEALLKEWLTPNTLTNAHGQWDITDCVATASPVGEFDPDITREGIYRGNSDSVDVIYLVTDVPHPRYRTKAIWCVESKRLTSLTFWTCFPHEGGWFHHRVGKGFTDKMLRQSLIRLSLAYGFIAQ